MDTNSVLDEPLGGGGGAAGGGAAGGMALPPSQWPLSQAVIKRPLISNINWSQFRAYSLLSPPLPSNKLLRKEPARDYVVVCDEILSLVCRSHLIIL